MKTLRVASLDFRARAWLLGLALIMAILAWVLPWFVPHLGSSLTEARAAMASVFALSTVVAASLLLGVGFWSTELQEGRMSFFLARPLSAGQLFAGRLVSALGLVLLCGILAFAPAFFKLTAILEAVQSLSFLLGLCLVILLLGNLVSVSLRARTPWILLDIISLALMGVILVECINMALSLLWTSREAQALMLGSFYAGLLVLGLGTYAALASGRISQVRSHQAMSVTVLSGMIAVWVAGATVRHTLVRVNPSDFHEVAWASGGSEGPWLAVGSRAPLDVRWKGQVGYALYNTATREGFRLPTSEVYFSHNGRTAVWWAFHVSPFGGGITLQRAKLGPLSADVVDTGIRPDLSSGVGTYNSDLAISDDGALVASRSGNWLAVHDLRSGSQLFRQALPGVGSGPVAGRGGLLFLDSTHLRAYAPGLELGAPLGIFEVDLKKGMVERTGELQGTAYRPIRAMDLQASRLVLERNEGGERVLELRDARSGALIAGLTHGTREPRIRVSFLADGSLILLAADSRKASLNRIDRVGRIQWEVTLPEVGSGGTILPALDAWAGSEAAKVTLRARDASGWKVSSTYRVDLRDGRYVPDPEPVPLRPAWGPELWRRGASGDLFYRRFEITESGSLVATHAGGTTEWVLGPR